MKGGHPRCDGVYVSEPRDGDDDWDEGESRSVVRFLDAHEVLTVGVGSTDDPVTLAGHVARWLAPGHPHVSKGRYEHDDDAGIHFVASCSYGRVSYAGRISEDGLAMELAWHSDINGNSGTERYCFVPVAVSTLPTTTEGSRRRSSAGSAVPDNPG